MKSDDCMSLGCFPQICLNDDLVAKKFAYYDSQSVDGKWLDETEQTPMMLAQSILTQTTCKTMNKKKTVDKMNLLSGQYTPCTHNPILPVPDPQKMVNCIVFCVRNLFCLCVKQFLQAEKVPGIKNTKGVRKS